MGNIPIRKDYTIQEGEHEKVKQAEFLQKFGFIKLEKIEFAFCRKCGNPTAVENSNSQIICGFCSSLIMSPQREATIKIKDVNYNRIFKDLSSKISSLGFDYKFDKTKTIWYVKVRNKIIPIFILGISTHNLIFSCSKGKGSLGILLDSEKFGNFINETNSFYFLDFNEILNSPSIIKHHLEGIALQFKQNYSLELEERFIKLMRRLSPSEFEKFVEEFLSYLKKSSKTKLQEYYDFLNVNKNCMENTKFIILGGPGNPDFKIINLLDYLTNSFRPEKFGECKKFFNVVLNMDKYGKAIAHSLEKDVLFILSNNEVNPGVWMNIFLLKEKYGYYKHSIIDRDLLLTLINVLGLEDLLREPP